VRVGIDDEVRKMSICRVAMVNWRAQVCHVTGGFQGCAEIYSR
jgi:hypothetical protein